MWSRSKSDTPPDPLEGSCPGPMSWPYIILLFPGRESFDVGMNADNMGLSLLPRLVDARRQGRNRARRRRRPVSPQDLGGSYDIVGVFGGW